MTTQTEIVPVETDVLIIGGGLAGCMAAIKAAEQDVSVTIAEKADTRASGCAGTGIDHMWGYVPPVHEKMGYSIEDIIESHTKGIAGGFIDPELLHFIVRESYNRVLDLESFGLNFRYEDSKAPGKFRVVTQFHSAPTTLNFDGRDLKVLLTRAARNRGVRIMNRITMVELLPSPEGQITGALGVGTRDGKIYFFKTKTVITSTGRVNRLSRSLTGVWGNTRVPIYETGDGRAMAFRAGLPIINMEFLSNAMYSIGNFELNLGAPRNTVQPAAAVVNGDGEVIVPRTRFFDWDKLDERKTDSAKALQEMFESRRTERPDFFALHDQGKGPFYLDLTGGTDEEIEYIEWSIRNEGKGSYFLDYLKKQEHFDFRKDKLEWLPNSREMAGTASSGLVVNKDLETGIKGLFAAGDEVGGLPWVCAPGAVTMGWRAGEMAARQAVAQKSFMDVKEDRLNTLRDLCDGMVQNKGGMHWREVETAVQNIVDHYAGKVRAEKMLLRAIDRLKEIRQNMSLGADTPHELSRCLEVLSVIENAEMVVRASLERKESRRMPFGFYRADYPESNNKEFFAFLAQQLKGDQVEFSKIDIKS
jgi:succinate dehydrogenase/fumarate reductase flavoprotein subunit